MTSKRADLVLSGGGVKGIGLVGAVVALMEAGYTAQCVSGTSAGSIVGSIVTAAAQGQKMTASEVKELALSLNYREFLYPGPRESVPLIGPSVALLRGTGIYRGDHVRDWVRDQLKSLGVSTFGDLAYDDPDLPPERRYRLVVTVADVTTGQLVRLPWDYRRGDGGGRARTAVRRRGARIYVDPVLLPSRQLDQPGWAGVHARRRRHSVQLPDRLPRPDGREETALADLRGHAAAEPSRGQ